MKAMNRGMGKARWVTKRLGDVCTFENGDTGTNYPSRSARTSDGIPFINAGHLTDDGIDIQRMNYIPRERFDLLGSGKIRSGDILFCLRGSLGKCASVGSLSEGAIASSLVIVRPREAILNAYVLAYFQSDICADMISQFKNGAAQPNLSAHSLSSFTIPYPPLPEQQRIVGILDEAFDGIATAKANAEKNLQNARRLFNCALVALADKVGQDGWLKTTVADVALSKKGSIRTGPFGSQLLHGEFVEEGIAVLGIDNAVANEFRWAKKRCITLDRFRQLSRYQVRPGDVLITIMGTCGRCAIVPDDIPPAINTKHLCCITLDHRKCLPGFLHAYFLYHPIAQQFLAKRAKGSIMAGLNMGIIEELPLLLPPIDQQKAIVKKLDALRAETRRLEAIYRQKLAVFDALKKSLLDQAFTGLL
jgi:type I restriction enzyme S subunit